MRENHDIKYGVVIPARNEEKTIPYTLKSLWKQSIKPTKIVVVDDASLDKTATVAENMGAYVIRVKRKCKFPATGSPLLAYIINKGLSALKDQKLDYVMIVGSGDIFPKHYVYDLVTRMSTENVVLASGSIWG